MKNIYIGLAVTFFVLSFASMGLCKPNLIAAYTFDNDTGNQVRDVSGNGHNGVAKDTKVVDGKFGKALEFDGAKSQVEIPSNAKMNPKTAITIEAWVKPSKYNDLSAVAQKWGDISNRRQYLLCFVADKVRFYISGTGGTWPSAAGTTAVKTGEWTHIAGSYDSKFIRVFVNGKMEIETANTEGLFGSDLPTWLGGYGSDDEFASNRHFPGVIDELRFWDGALTEQEIQQGMAGPITPVNIKDKLATKWGSLKN